jgi:2-polyprenyl-3-methyl-5-hydroxy-6-metoxy-1,4-benzoquinol methylase
MDTNQYSQRPRLSTAALSAQARALYQAEPNTKIRLLQGLRPHICPFGDVMEQVPAGASVLDVGCGAGLFLLLLGQQGRIRHALGFDVSAPSIEAANRAARNAGLAATLEFQVRSIEDGIPEGPWNVVTVVDVLHHVPAAHQRAFVASLCERIPPGGRLVIKDMVAQPRWRAFANQMHDLVMARQWVHQQGPETVDGWVQSLGLRRIYRSRINSWWYGHWTLVYERAE